MKKSLEKSHQFFAAAAVLALSHFWGIAKADDTCRNISGTYRVMNDCTIQDETVGSTGQIKVTQSGCTAVQIEATIEKFIQPPPAIPNPYSGPYDLCALSQFDCGLYGDNCELYKTPECQAWLNQVWPEPIRQEKIVKKAGTWADVKLTRAATLGEIFECKIHSRVSQ